MQEKPRLLTNDKIAIFKQLVSVKSKDALPNGYYDSDMIAQDIISALQEQVRVLREAFIKARETIEFIEQEAYNESSALHEISYHLKKKLVGLEGEKIEQALAATKEGA